MPPRPTRRRPKSESEVNSSPFQRRLLEPKRKSSGSVNDVIQVTATNRSKPMSPLAKDLLIKSCMDSDSNESSFETELSNSSAANDSPEPASSSSKKGPALKRCPCGNSSGGKAWILKCTSCTQVWHNSCANLKGNLPKSIIDQLDHWQCPWCFVSPYKPPGKHRSVLTADSLSATVLSDTIITVIEDCIKDSLKSSVTEQSTELLASIHTELDKLSKEVKEFAQITHPLDINGSDMPLQRPQEPIGSVKSDMAEPQCNAFSNYRENFITQEEASGLVSFFDQEEFVVEGSRKVVMYGEKYHYKGSNGSPKPIPESLTRLTEKVKTEMGLQYDLNQILVNKYEPSNSLPPHSDNEGSIRPDSSIMTVSLNAPAKIEFSNIKTGLKEELDVAPNSLYEMSRQSQNYFKHQVISNTSDQARYSITFRCVHWTNYNSTCAIGDSNFGHIEFGSGHGKVGTATPGVKEWAACVKDIEPSKCASYRNVVLMCGTNDLKVKDSNVKSIYQLYKGKVEQIREVNQYSNIFICPVLPSSDWNLNQKINDFNRLLFTDMQNGSMRINIVQGFNVFADHSGVLKPSLHDRRTPTDKLHINNKGYSILVKLIKQAIFSVKRSKNRSSAGRLYSQAARSR